MRFTGINDPHDKKVRISAPMHCTISHDLIVLLALRASTKLSPEAIDDHVSICRLNEQRVPLLPLTQLCLLLLLNASGVLHPLQPFSLSGTLHTVMRSGNRTCRLLTAGASLATCNKTLARLAPGHRLAIVGGLYRDPRSSQPFSEACVLWPRSRR